MPIPKIIHQTWRSTELPERFRPLQASWRRLHPDWEYRFYDDRACRDHVATHFPELLDLYDGCPHPVQRADIFRYLVVAKFGGVYADIDVEALRPHDPLLQGRSALFGAEDVMSPRRMRAEGFDHSERIANFIFATEPGHPIWDSVVAWLRALPGRWDLVSEVLRTTGPAMLTRIVQPARASLEIEVLPPIVWAPWDWRFWFPWRPDRRIHARHHFAGTWKPSHRAAVEARRAGG